MMNYNDLSGNSSKHTLHLGDCRTVMATLDDNSIDSIVCDPPYELGFMGKAWDNTGIAYDVTVWQQCLRVLKPGGHLVAFGGSRTYHRLAVAIEDAGFEIRDQIQWIYGSGFPKSLDVSKALDKQNGDHQLSRRLRFTEWVRSTGLTASQIDKATGTFMGSHYTTSASQPAIMTRAHLDAVRHLIGTVPDWVEVEVIRQESEAWKSRPVVTGEDMFGEYEVVENYDGDMGGFRGVRLGQSKRTITAPSTDLAKQWQGWGTAAKPAFEPAVLAYKPHESEHGIIVANLIKLEAQLWLMWFASTAEWSSTSSPHDLSVVLSIAQWTAAELIHTRDDLCGQMDTSQFAEVMISCLSIVTSWKNIWSEASKLGNTFIIETVLSPIIGWTTLKSSLSQITPNFITREWMQHGGDWSSVLSAASPFIVVSKKLKSTLELIAVERAISRTSNPGSIDSKTTNEPAVLARKPLCGTVADNVMTWGVGALNIDGTRIAHNEPIKMMKAQTSKESMTGNGKFGQAGRHADVAELKESGRWPANVILDEDAATALDEQSGDNVSRFFYTAKASKSEREAGITTSEVINKGSGFPQRANHHPTVKPLSLMRYLVRLVTPKGGKVLDPFMGSGSTGCAAVLEGFDFVGIDITPEYVAIAQKRIDHYAVTSPLMNL